MKNLRRDIGLMLVPVLMLAGAGWVWRHRSSATLRVGNDPLYFTMQSAQAAALTPREVWEGFDTKITVILKQHGLNQGVFDTPAISVQAASGKGNIPILDKIGAPVKVARRGDEGYNADSHSITYLLRLRDVPVGDEIHLEDRVRAVTILRRGLLSPALNVDVPVRESRQQTSLPVVSRDPGFKLERYAIEQVPTEVSYLKLPGGKLRPSPVKHRVTFFVRKTGPAMNDPKRRLRIESKLELQDTKAKSSAPLWTRPYALGTRRRGSFSTTPFDLLSAQINNPIFITGELWIEDKWPKPIRIPFTDKNGKILLTPQK